MPNFRSMCTSALALAVIVLGAAGCDANPKSGYGFSLPDGDVARGEAVFSKYVCYDCHVVDGRPELKLQDDTIPLMQVELGGETTRIQTYGELVTSVINPSHEISQKYSGEPVEYYGISAMRNHNENMTVAELIDLVAFLQEQYELIPYTPTAYTPY